MEGWSTGSSEQAVEPGSPEHSGRDQSSAAEAAQKIHRHMNCKDTTLTKSHASRPGGQRLDNITHLQFLSTEDQTSAISLEELPKIVIKLITNLIG